MLTQKVNGLRLKVDASDHSLVDTAKLVQSAYRRRNKLSKAIKKAASPSKKKDLQRLYAASPMVKLTYVLDAVTPDDEPLTIDHLIDKAYDTNLFLASEEPVTVLSKRKENDKGYRFYCMFGPRHKLGQKIVADLISMEYTPKSYQFGVRKRGVQSAVKEIKKVVSLGYSHVLRLDVKKFFDSFNHSALADAVPVDASLFEHCAIGKHYHTIAGAQSTAPPYQKAVALYADLVRHAGIPLGSAASPAIGAYFMSKLDVKMPAGAVFINYVDDFLVLAKTPELASQAHEALQSALTGLSVGDFKLLGKPSSSPSPNFDFLGHMFTFDEAGKLHVSVHPANGHKVTNKAVMGIEELKEHIQTPTSKGVHSKLHDMAVSYARHLYGWINTFSQAENIKAWRVELDKYIELYCHLAQVDLTVVLAKVKAMKLAETPEYIAS